MPELTVADVVGYTHGRLAADDTETTRLLNAALGMARRYCGWHVTPVQPDDVVTLDGTGGALLALPTLRLVELTELVEDGITADLTYVERSARGLLRKKAGYLPGPHHYGPYWTNQLGGITATMTHGFADAPEWQSAVLSLVDRTSMVLSSGGPEVIGPFQFPSTGSVGTLFNDGEKMLLDLYRLEDPA